MSKEENLVGSPELDLVYDDPMTPNRYNLLSRALAVENTKVQLIQFYHYS